MALAVSSNGKKGNSFQHKLPLLYSLGGHKVIVGKKVCAVGDGLVHSIPVPSSYCVVVYHFQTLKSSTKPARIGKILAGFWMI